MLFLSFRFSDTSNWQIVSSSRKIGDTLLLLLHAIGKKFDRVKVLEWTNFLRCLHDTWNVFPSHENHGRQRRIGKAEKLEFFFFFLLSHLQDFDMIAINKFTALLDWEFSLFCFCCMITAVDLRSSVFHSSEEELGKFINFQSVLPLENSKTHGAHSVKWIYWPIKIGKIYHQINFDFMRERKT